MNDPLDDHPFDPEDSVRNALEEMGRAHVCASDEGTPYAAIPEPHNHRCPERSRELSQQRFPAE